VEEAALDLVRLSGGVGAWLLRESEDAVRAASAARGSGGENALTLSVADVFRHRMATETHVVEVARAALPSAYSSTGFSARAFRDLIDDVEHLVLVKGEPEAGALVRVHSECLTGDALGSLRCDCGEQLRAAMARIGACRSGAVVYLRGHEGRGIGLANKIRAYALQDQGLDTAEANAALGFSHDARDYGSAAQILRAIGLQDIRLLSNNPLKAEALSAYGVRVREELPLSLGSNPHNAGYLQTKRDKMGHRLPGGSAPPRSAVVDG
jgi:3,4-dihydroxy 2-butanone 4-phosphate synthase/GTP cyclohydrolase II